MVVVQLGEDVRSVRQKIGMEANDYLSLWRSINGKAQEICERTYGIISLKQANTLSAIKELKSYYVNNESEDQEIRQKMISALAVDGFAAWIIHNHIKRNNNKIRKAQQAMQPSTPPNPTGKSAGETSAGDAEENITGRVIFDPIRNV